jgi:hypothetical protein
MSINIVSNLQGHILNRLEQNDDNGIMTRRQVEAEDAQCRDTERVVTVGGKPQFWRTSARQRHCSAYRELLCIRSAAVNAAKEAAEMVTGFIQLMSLLAKHVPSMKVHEITRNEQMAVGQKIGQILFMMNERSCGI